jgi:hypothetical protein
MKRNITLLGTLGVIVATGLATARGDVFVLTTQGEVRGELLNPDDSPRRTYVVKTPGGGTVILAADQVKEVRPQTPAEIKYDRYRGDCPDTAAGHWKMAEWCRENRLSKQRQAHLKRVLELDPDHEQARHALGYSQISGRWVTQEQVMRERGYVKSKHAPGKWVLPQEEALLEKRKQTKNAQMEWMAKVKRWSSWLDTDKAGMAIEGLKSINDPLAVLALSKYLKDDRRREARLLYVQALSRINVSASMEVLINTSLYDEDDEVRLAALDEVVARNYLPGVAMYVQALRHKDNEVVNRAAVALGQLKDPLAIGPLIDALVTTHTFVVQKGQPGQTQATFGNLPGGGGGYNFGGSSTEIIKKRFENRDVLQALVDLTGGTSFNFDVKAWKYWYVGQKKPKTLDARRDGA